ELRGRAQPRVPVAVRDDGGGKRRVDADVDLYRTPVAGRDPDSDPATRGTVAGLPRVDRRQHFGRLLHAVDGRVPKEQPMTVGRGGLALALRPALAVADLEEVAKVCVDGYVGFERRVAPTRILDRPYVLDRARHADASLDLQASERVAKQRAVWKDLRREQSQRAGGRSDFVVRNVTRVPRV